MAERETLVSTEMPLAKSRISSAGPNPALPTTKPSLRNKMIPKMVKTLGVKTPAKVPRVPPGAGHIVLATLCICVFVIFHLLKRQNQSHAGINASHEDWPAVF